MLWGDAADYCSGWDGAWFEIDLITRELYVKLSTYPNQFGASRENKRYLSAFEFHNIAIKYGFAEEVKFLSTDEDWGKLFDYDFNLAISNVDLFLKKQNEEKIRKEQEENAIVIPAEFENIKPAMDLTSVYINLNQPYAISDVKINNKNNLYFLEYVSSSKLNMSSENNIYNRTLTTIESAWLEHTINNVLSDNNNKTWQSLPGGDKMSVRIVYKGKVCENYENLLPLEKYTDLKSLLYNLAKYGSR